MKYMSYVNNPISTKYQQNIMAQSSSRHVRHCITMRMLLELLIVNCSHSWSSFCCACVVHVNRGCLRDKWRMLTCLHVSFSCMFLKLSHFWKHRKTCVSLLHEFVVRQNLGHGLLFRGETHAKRANSKWRNWETAKRPAWRRVRKLRAQKSAPATGGKFAKSGASDGKTRTANSQTKDES